MPVEYDEIGVWSEVKLAIIKKYASAYTSIMDSQRREKIPSLRWLYIDAYAGPGYHLSKTSGELVEGSPLIALNTSPPYHEYHFIDTDAKLRLTDLFCSCRLNLKNGSWSLAAAISSLSASGCNEISCHREGEVRGS